MTGELASGKTTALHIFEKLGANVFSADDEIEKLYADRGFIDRLKVKFPEAFTDGELNKTVLLTHFSQDKVYKRKYERYLWSELRSVLNDYLITHTDRPVVAEIPLLFESGYHRLFSFTVGIETEPETQEKYLVQREKDPAAAERLRTLGASNGYNRFRDKLDYIIVNNGTIKELETKIEKVYREILAK